jgi:hypothetical protein
MKAKFSPQIGDYRGFERIYMSFLCKVVQAKDITTKQIDRKKSKTPMPRRQTLLQLDTTRSEHANIVKGLLKTAVDYIVEISSC